MAEPLTLARPYARAAFEVARDSRAYGVWSGVLDSLAQILKDPAVAPLLSDPRLARGALADVLVQAVARDAPYEAQALVRLLAENHRLGIASALADEFRRLREEAESIVEVEITTASAVDERQKEVLVRAVQQRLQRTLKVSWNTDAALIGGALIRAGDLVIDGSLRGELDRMSQALAR